MENSAKPDLKTGFPADNLPDGGMILGQADGEDVILARRGDELFAVGASCTHYHGPLADGLVVGETVRCPWHHACFSLRTGEAHTRHLINRTLCARRGANQNAIYGTGIVTEIPFIAYVDRRATSLIGICAPEEVFP